jgi:hypothetical protein
MEEYDTAALNVTQTDDEHHKRGISMVLSSASGFLMFAGRKTMGVCRRQAR